MPGLSVARVASFAPKWSEGANEATMLSLILSRPFFQPLSGLEVIFLTLYSSLSTVHLILFPLNSIPYLRHDETEIPYFLLRRHKVSS